MDKDLENELYSACIRAEYIYRQNDRVEQKRRGDERTI